MLRCWRLRLAGLIAELRAIRRLLADDSTEEEALSRLDTWHDEWDALPLVVQLVGRRKMRRIAWDLLILLDERQAVTLGRLEAHIEVGRQLVASRDLP